LTSAPDGGEWSASGAGILKKNYEKTKTSNIYIYSEDSLQEDLLLLLLLLLLLRHSFLTSWQSLSWSRNYPPSMEPLISLSCTQ